MTVTGLSTASSLVVTGSATVSGLLVVGSSFTFNGNTVKASAGTNTFTVPAPGVNADFVLTEGDSTIGAATLTVRKDQAATTQVLVRNHTANSAASAAVSTYIDSTSGGDPFVSFQINGGTSWSEGADNSDSDKWKLSRSAALGTNDTITADSSEVAIPSQNLRVGGTSITSGKLMVLNNGSTGISNQGDILTERYAAGSAGADMYFRKYRGTFGSPTIVSSGDNIGNLYFGAYDGGSVRFPASIEVTVDGATASGDTPGQISFYTAPDGSSTRAERLRIDNSGDVVPGGAGTQNLGDASNYWNDVSYKTLTDRGCLGFFDDGVENWDGTHSTDLASFAKIKRHPTKKTVYGAPMLDYRTFPKVAYRKAAYEQMNGDVRVATEYPRDQDDAPYYFTVEKSSGPARVYVSQDEIPDEDRPKAKKALAEDGIEMTSMFSIMIGAFKEAHSRIEALEARVAALEAEVKVKEK
jgi:hypothetical protein